MPNKRNQPLAGQGNKNNKSDHKPEHESDKNTSIQTPKEEVSLPPNDVDLNHLNQHPVVDMPRPSEDTHDIDLPSTVGVAPVKQKQAIKRALADAFTGDSEDTSIALTHTKVSIGSDSIPNSVNTVNDYMTAMGVNQQLTSTARLGWQRKLYGVIHFILGGTNQDEAIAAMRQVISLMADNANGAASAASLFREHKELANIRGTFIVEYQAILRVLMVASTAKTQNEFLTKIDLTAAQKLIRPKRAEGYLRILRGAIGLA